MDSQFIAAVRMLVGGAFPATAPRGGATERRRGKGVLLAAVVCALALLSGGVAQAAHVHDAPLSEKRHVLLAPSDQCPVCAATQVSTPAVSQAAVEPMPRVEWVVVAARAMQAPVQRWSFELFSRPPPAGTGVRA